MHSAPSVSFPVGRSRSAGRLLLVLWVAGAACAGAAILQSDAAGWRAGVEVVAVLGAGMLAALAHRRERGGELRFDGQGWTLTGDSSVAAARLAPALDMQSVLLVQLTAADRRSRWFWLERTRSPQRWLDLRRAVYSRAPSPDPVDPGADSARFAGRPPSAS